MFRSITAGLVATSPTLFTLLVVYGAMGLMEVHLDIGTSMLASLIIGAGVDYSVHLMAAWTATTKEALQHSVAENGSRDLDKCIHGRCRIFCFISRRGQTSPKCRFTTAAAMLAAAIGTFLVIPVFTDAHGIVGLNQFATLEGQRRLSSFTALGVLVLAHAGAMDAPAILAKLDDNMNQSASDIKLASYQSGTGKKATS